MKQWTQDQYVEMMDRKEAARAEASRDEGRPLGRSTATTILNPDTKIADIHVFEGFHLRIGWKTPEAGRAYKGSFKHG